MVGCDDQPALAAKRTYRSHSRSSDQDGWTDAYPRERNSSAALRMILLRSKAAMSRHARKAALRGVGRLLEVGLPGMHEPRDLSPGRRIEDGERLACHARAACPPYIQRA